MGLFDSKRPKSALMRDRAYKSNEPHEQAYVRKTRPKNPRYMADGGSIEENKRMAVETFLGGLTNDELYYVANEYADLDWDDDANLDNQIQMWIKSLSNEDINMMHEELLGYKRGGRVYKTGRAYKTDRARFNKSEDWEVPMNKRGGKSSRTMKAPSKSSVSPSTGKSKYSYIPNSMLREAEVENKGKTTYIDGADILDGIYVKKGTKYANGGRVKKYNYVPNRMIEAIEVERNGKTTEIDGANILDGIYVKGKVKFADGGMADGGEVKSMKEMMDSCYTYGGLDKGSYNYERYILPYKGRLGEKMFDKVYNQYSDLLKSDYEVEGNTYTDSEGLTYNTLKKKYANGGMMDYGSDLTDESTVRGNITNGEIHCDTLTEIIGCEPNYPCHNVGSLKLTKCFLRPYYKIG